MIVSTNGINFITKLEGCKLKAYKCPAGIWTIGVGHTGQVKETDVITEDYAKILLDRDLEPINKFLSSEFPMINQNQFDALASFIFNIGLGAFKKSTMYHLLKEADFDKASEQFDKWVYANHVKLEGLVKRRNKEKELFLSE